MLAPLVERRAARTACVVTAPRLAFGRADGESTAKVEGSQLISSDEVQQRAQAHIPLTPFFVRH